MRRRIRQDEKWPTAFKIGDSVKVKTNMLRPCIWLCGRCKECNDYYKSQTGLDLQETATKIQGQVDAKAHFEESNPCWQVITFIPDEYGFTSGDYATCHGLGVLL